MCHLRISVIMIVILFCVSPGYTQQAVVSTGGEVAGAGGTLSSSVGLTDFQNLSNDFWSIQFGMQQTHKAQLIHVDPDQPEGGIIIGGGSHPIGSEIWLRAQADPGWEFVMWFGNFIGADPIKHSAQSTNNPINIIVQEDTYINASFKLLEPVAVTVSKWAVLSGMVLIVVFVLIRYTRTVI